MHGRRPTWLDFEDSPTDKLVIRRVPRQLLPWQAECTKCRRDGQHGLRSTTSFDGPDGIVGAAQRHALTVHRVVL